MKEVMKEALGRSLPYPGVKRFYSATNAVLPQLEPVVDVLLNLNEAVMSISVKYEIPASELMDWVLKQLPTNLCEDIDEDIDEDTDDDE